MNWIVRLSNEAAKQLKKFPIDHQALIRKRLREMRGNPLQGNITPLKGKWKGRYRRTVFRDRIFFILHHQERLIEISAIRLRTKKTYR
jgi:mRNA-degrading endonuclease RelE of RelBE toxin-antitoxin system